MVSECVLLAVARDTQEREREERKTIDENEPFGPFSSMHLLFLECVLLAVARDTRAVRCPHKLGILLRFLDPFLPSFF